MKPKTATNGNMKCRNCRNRIKEGMKYLEFRYPFHYVIPRTEKMGKIFGIFIGGRKGAEEYSPIKKVKTRYQRYCQNCLFWLFHNLQDDYETWLKTKVVKKL